MNNSLDIREVHNYVLGVRTAKNWVGEEIIFMKDKQPFLYTATTLTNVKALTMNRANMFETFGRFFPEYLSELIQRGHQRYKMYRLRQKSIDESRESMGHAIQFKWKDRKEFE